MPKRYFRITPFHRAIAVLLICLEAVVGWPTVVLGQMAQEATAETAPPDNGTRIGTKEYPADVEARKSEAEEVVEVKLELEEEPSDVDLQMARVFFEPLIPLEGEAQEGENVALGRALKAYVDRADKDDISALEGFLQAYPESRWKAALQTNLGIVRRKAGYFTEALERLEEAWELGKAATTVEAKVQADRAVGELADLNARFGRYDRMAELFAETEPRDIVGTAQSLLEGAKEGYWRMTKKPAAGFRCGPYAVNAMLDAGKKYVPNPKISKEPSSSQGTNLQRLEELAAEVGMSAVAAQKGARGEWQVPMVVHWKVGHFAAITKKEKGRYLVKDPTFGGEIWVTKKALDAEATGYGLVNAEKGKVPKGWTKITDEEAAEVWGKGGATGTDDGKCPEKTKDGCGGRMAEFNMLKMRGTLEITDFPVGYAPPAGPEIEFMTRYKHLETGQPSNFNFTNFGPYWMTNWVSYVEIDNGGTVTLKGGDGGVEVSNYSSYSPVTGRFAAALYTSTVMHKVSATRYEREWPDGSRQVFSQPDGTGRLFLKEVIDPHGNKAVLNFDGNMRLTSIVDAIGQSTTVSYKSNTPGNAGFYKVYRVTDPFGRYAEFTYDGFYTELMKITDVIGIESSLTYGEDGFISRMTTPYGKTEFYQYSPAEQWYGRGLLAVLPDGSKEVVESYIGHDQTTYYWDRKAMAMAPGDRSKAEETRWLMSNEGYLLMDIPLWRRKALEAKVEYKYPAQPSPTLSPDPEEPGVYHNYVGTSRRPIEIKRVLDDASVQISQFEYNNRGNVTKAIDPAGRTYSVVYAGNGVDVMEVRQTRAGNNDLLSKMTYDGRHNMLTRTDASGRTTAYAYNSRSQITSITNAKSEVTTATYDGDGYLTQIDGPLSGTNDRTEADYDSYGRIASVTAVEGPTSGTDHYTLTYSYDALDRLTQVTFPDGTTEQTVYSRLNPLRSKDRLGRWTQYVHNALGELVEERDPLGRITRYEWCRCGALQGLTDAAGNVTKWAYDVQGRLIKKTYADSSHEDYEYETTISRLKRITDPAGNVTNYAYNIDNTLDESTTDPVSGYADVPDVSVSWDANYRRVSSVGDSYGTFTYTYNAYAMNFFGSGSNGRGRLASIANSALADADISYEYDELGRVTERQIDGAANEATWAYDAAGRVSSWANALGTFTPTYVNASYGVNRLDNVAFPNGQVVNYDWEANTGDFRLREIENLGASSVAVSKFTYVTDAASRIREWTQQRGSSTPERYDIGYDAADQVTGAVLRNTSTSAIVKQYYYGYDTGSNRTTEQVDSTVTTSSYNNLNQLTGSSAGGKTRFRGTIGENGTVTVGGQAAWMTGGTNFQADVNLTTGTNTIAVVAMDASSNTRTNSYQVVVPSGGSTTLTYDANGNMLDDDTQTYNWDAKNRLVKTTYASGACTEYRYDVFGRRVKIVEKNSGGTVTSTKQFVFDGMEEAEQRDGSNAVTKRYFADGCQDVTGGASYFYTKDHLGSVREVMDGSGALAARYDYDPYGRTTKVSGGVDSDMLYTGHYYDVSSGLYLTMYRAYNSNLARWLSRDPIGEAGGINLYGYVSNDPVNLWDAFGLCDSDDITDQDLKDALNDILNNGDSPNDVRKKIGGTDYDTKFKDQDKYYNYKGRRFHSSDINFIGVGAGFRKFGFLKPTSRAISFWWKFYKKGNMRDAMYFTDIGYDIQDKFDPSQSKKCN